MSRPPNILWFRRDLRFGDHPALAKAASRGQVLALFVLDPALMSPAGLPRRAFLIRTLCDMDRRLRAFGAQLVMQEGRPEEVVPEVARRVGATEVHVSADFGPYGTERDHRVAAALGSVPLVQTGSPYAVSPHRLTTVTGQTYRVFTPYFRAWRRHGWPGPASSDPQHVDWITLPGDGVPDEPPFRRVSSCLPLARTRHRRRGGVSERRASPAIAIRAIGQISTRRPGSRPTCIWAFSIPERFCLRSDPMTSPS